MDYTGRIIKHENVLTQKRTEELYDLFRYHFPWYYGETEYNLPPSGMITNFFYKGEWSNKEIYDELFDLLVQRDSWFKTATLQRAYINLFSPNEETHMHVDGECITVLFYINPYMDIKNGGETQFIVDGDIVGALPYPNRMVIFDGMIQHKAIPFRSFRMDARLTIAMKFAKSA